MNELKKGFIFLGKQVFIIVYALVFLISLFIFIKIVLFLIQKIIYNILGHLIVFLFIRVNELYLWLISFTILLFFSEIAKILVLFFEEYKLLFFSHLRIFFEQFNISYGNNNWDTFFNAGFEQ